MVRYKLFALAASAGCAALIAGTTQAQAQQQYNLCDIENVPASFIERLRDRPDFNAIAQRVANSCPGSLEALTGTATASVGGAAASGGGADEYNLCDIEEVPEDVRARVRGRADFDEILLQMTEVCGDSALILAEGPTASVAQGFSGRRTPEPNENIGAIGGSPNSGGGNGGNDGGDPENGGGDPENGGGDPENGGGDPENGGGDPENGGGDPENGGGGPQNPGNDKPVGNSPFDDETGDEPSGKKDKEKGGPKDK